MSHNLSFSLKNNLNAYYIGAYANFEDSPDIEYLWRMYIQDESLKLTMFRGIDRIKLTKIILDR